MRMFALKDKNTGEWLEGPASKTRITAYEDKAECEAVKDYFPEKEPVTVTLREEPIEPCEWCGFFAGIGRINIGGRRAIRRPAGQIENPLCMNCGRRLKYD